jgi:hypothetical protein
MSGDDWEKELAGMKDSVGSSPHVPHGPVRRATPPPGGFVVPPLEKPGKKKLEPPKPVKPKAPPGPAPAKAKELSKPGAPAVKPVLPVDSKKPASVRLVEVRTALRKTTREAKAAETAKKARPKNWKRWLSVLISVLLLAVMALSVAAGYHFRARRGVEFYIEKLKSEDPAIQSYARDSLSSFGAVAVPNLGKLVGGEDEREALAAVDTLALIDCKESADLLMRLTTHANANIRKRALSALGERGAPQAFSYIKEQISSPDHETRICAIAALENYDPQKSVPILLTLLDDEGWQIRNAAAMALTRITGQNLGIPKSTYTVEMNRIIRERWREWWQENSPTFQRPKEGQN